MTDTYAVRFVDRQTAAAWLDLRLSLADRFAAALEDGAMEPVEIVAPTGQVLTVEVADEHVIIRAGDVVHAADNVDRAAYLVYRILYAAWNVVHPAFLASPLIPQPREGDCAIPAASAARPRTPLPVRGRAASPEELQQWVVEVFNDWISEPLKVAKNGHIPWKTPGGNSVGVRVCNATRIEFYSTIATEVSERRAHRQIDQLSRDAFGLKFFLDGDSLICTQIIVADPFVPEVLTNALSTFIGSIDELDWVQEKVIGHSARAERKALEEALEELDQARCEAASLRQALAEQVEDLEQSIRDLQGEVEMAEQERDDALDRLQRLQTYVAGALGPGRAPGVRRDRESGRAA